MKITKFIVIGVIWAREKCRSSIIMYPLLSFFLKRLARAITVDEDLLIHVNFEVILVIY
jgi:hypothetical protein